LLYPRSSANVINLAYHLAVFEKTTGQPISQVDGILEFGGGYGCLCRLTRRLGYTGPYVIFDLAASCALQSYYLRTNGIDDVTHISDLPALRAAINAMPNPCNALFIATWSMSETPIEGRDGVLELTQKFGWFLLAYQEDFAGIDNEHFFSDWAKRRDDIAWTKLAIPSPPGHAYLFGKRL
jgi:hypothetical protein